MVRSIDDYVGTFTIRNGSESLTAVTGTTPLVQIGYWLCIGTGDFGDPPPDGTKVGLSIVDPNSRQRILPAEGFPPVYAYMNDGTLNGSSYWIDGQALPQLLAYQVSLMTMITANTGLYKTVSILITVGDPENAGVWAADDQSGG